MEQFCENKEQDGRQGEIRLSTDAVDRRTSLDKCHGDFTHEDDIKLHETPIVYTTKLDDMDIFNRNSGDLDFNLRAILRESKPSFKNSILHISHTDQTSYDKVAKKIKEYNEKSSDKNVKNSDRYFPFAQENLNENETYNYRKIDMSEDLHIDNNNGYNLTENHESDNMDSRISRSGIENLFEDIPLDHKISNEAECNTQTFTDIKNDEDNDMQLLSHDVMQTNSRTKSSTPTSIIEIKIDEDDCMPLLNYDAIQTKTSSLFMEINNKSVKRNKKRKYKKNKMRKVWKNVDHSTTIVSDTDSDEEPLAVIKYKKQKLEQCRPLIIVLEDICIRRRKLRLKPFKGPGILYCGQWFKIHDISALERNIKNVYLFFHDKCAQRIDIYMIKNGRMREHKKVHFNKRSEILKYSFEQEDTMEIECYCWYERVQASLKALECGILSTYDVTFMKQPHNFERSTCVCCCVAGNSKEKESFAIGDSNICTEELEMKQMEEEITEKNCNNHIKPIYCSVLKHDDWNHRLKMENKNITLINECLKYDRVMEKENPLPKFSSRIFPNDLLVNKKYIVIKYKSVMLSKPKLRFVEYHQEGSSHIVRDRNTEPDLLSPITCPETVKIRLSMKPKPLLAPDRAIRRVAKFQIKRSYHENNPEVRTSSKCLQNSGNVTGPSTVNKASSHDECDTLAKCVHIPKNRKRGVVRQGKFSDKDHKLVINTKKAEYTESHKVIQNSGNVTGLSTVNKAGAHDECDTLAKCVQPPKNRKRGSVRRRKFSDKDKKLVINTIKAEYTESHKVIQNSGNVTGPSTVNKAGAHDECATLAKSVQAPKNKKRTVGRSGLFSDKDHEKILTNTKKGEFTETRKVKNIAELIDSLVSNFIGNEPSAKTSPQDPCTETPTEPQRSKDFVSSKTTHHNVNAAVYDSLGVDDLEVNSLITTILKRFEGIRLTIDENRKVTAALTMPVNTLSLSELKVLAIIISQAQQQVDTLALLPGSYMPKVNLRKDEHKNALLVDDTILNQQSSPRQETIHQVAQTEQKISEGVLLPGTKFTNFSSTENNSLGQMADYYHSSSSSPVVKDEAISSLHKDTDMLGNDARCPCARGLNDVDDAGSHVYKMFSRIMRKKIDCYKESFRTIKPYPIPDNLTPPIKISNVHSLVPNPATGLSPNKRKSHPKLPSKTKPSIDTDKKKLTDLISAQFNAEQNKSVVDDPSSYLSPPARTSQHLTILPNVRVVDCEIIFDESEPQLQSSETDRESHTINKACISHSHKSTNKTSENLGLPTPTFSKFEVKDDTVDNSCHNDSNLLLIAQLNAELNADLSSLNIPSSYGFIKNKDDIDSFPDTAEPKDFAIHDLDSGNNAHEGFMQLNEEVDIKEETESFGNELWSVKIKEED